MSVTRNSIFHQCADKSVWDWKSVSTGSGEISVPIVYTSPWSQLWKAWCTVDGCSVIEFESETKTNMCALTQNKMSSRTCRECRTSSRGRRMLRILAWSDLWSLPWFVSCSLYPVDLLTHHEHALTKVPVVNLTWNLKIVIYSMKLGCSLLGVVKTKYHNVAERSPFHSVPAVMGRLSAVFSILVVDWHWAPTTFIHGKSSAIESCLI